MAKKRKPKPTFDGHTFDSEEELEFYHWLVEAEKLGIINSFKYPVESYVLCEPVKIAHPQKGKKGQPIKPRVSHVLGAQKYTPDFEIEFSVQGAKRLSEVYVSGRKTKAGKLVAAKKIDFDFGLTLTVDVKGSFNPFMKENGSRAFEMSRKWLYQREGILVQKIVPWVLFQASWVPELVRRTPITRKLRAKYSDTTTFSEMSAIVLDPS